MKTRPILFSAPMVRAILEGRKTQTRRIAKKMIRHPDFGNLYTPGALVLEHEPQHVIDRCCPYGQPGDRLWVRETIYAWGRWETRYSDRKQRDEWHFIDMTLASGKQYHYFADGNNPVTVPRDKHPDCQWWKRPAIHAPRAASRITQEVVSVRVERLQDISEADAAAEGTPWDDRAGNCREAYRLLWNQINGRHAWDANPWVWVIEFKQVQP